MIHIQYTYLITFVDRQGKYSRVEIQRKKKIRSYNDIIEVEQELQKDLGFEINLISEKLTGKVMKWK